jgi:hypothetical protein
MPNQVLSKVDNVVNEQLSRVNSIENSLKKNVPYVRGTSPVQETEDFIKSYSDNLVDLRSGLNAFRSYIKKGILLLLKILPMIWVILLRN